MTLFSVIIIIIVPVIETPIKKHIAVSAMYDHSIDARNATISPA